MRYPERVVGRLPPNDRLRIGERGFLALAYAARCLEIEEVHHLLLDERAARLRLDRALIAAIFALDRARHIEAAQFLDGVVEHAVAKEVVPGFCKEPERGRHMGANRRAFRTRRALAPASLHLGPHRGVHALERNIADALLCH
jgi:hypothetical protein